MSEETQASGKPEVEQLTLRIAKPAFLELRARAKRKGVTVTEFIRQAIGTEMFIDEKMAEGARILIKHPNRRPSELVFR
jgi:hypothetical protein